MSTDPDKVLRDALKLPPEARAALAGSLIESLEDQVDEDAEVKWEKEIAKRIRELDGGAVRPVPWSEARRAIGGT
jgi:hypothetical protein